MWYFDLQEFVSLYKVKIKGMPIKKKPQLNYHKTVDRQILTTPIFKQRKWKCSLDNSTQIHVHYLM